MVYYFHTTSDACRAGRSRHSAGGRRDGVSGGAEDRQARLAPRQRRREGHQHFVADYQLYTKSVVLVDVRDGKSGRWKTCPRSGVLNDKTRFARYVQEETRAFMAAEAK